MKKFVVCFRTVMYLLALTLAFQSCNNDDDPVLNDKGQALAVIYDNAELDENSSEDTKTAPKTVWLQGDAIGVFCVEPGKDLGKVNFASNKKYVYNNGKFEPATDADKIWISREGSFKFYAYYPYSTSQTGVDINGRALEFKVAADQTTDASRTNSDIIAGRSTVVDNASGEVDMDFFHMMSDVRFSWTRSSSAQKEYVRTLFGTTAVIDLQALTSVQKSGEKPGAGIKMNIKTPYDDTSGSTEYQAFVPPVTISNEQELFVPYDAADKPLAAIKANLTGPTQKLEAGKTYDLAGDMYTITADVRRNGDLVPEKCDKYDGCTVSNTGGGDNKQLKLFVGRYLKNRECQISSVMGTGLPLGTQFIGWFEYDAKTGKWNKVEGADETYKFTVNKDRRLQARYENYVYDPWKITWDTPVTSGNTTPIINIDATDASSRSVTLRATRRVTLDGENVDDPALTTRENNAIVLKVQEDQYLPAGNLNRFNEPAWTYTESSKTIKSTANCDESGNSPVARKLVAHVVIDGQDMYTTPDKGGALDNPIDHSKVAQSTYLLTVNQDKGTVSYGDKDDSQWSVLIENAAAVNMKMEAKGTVNGATKGTFDAYIYRPRKVSGVVVDIETIAQANIQSAFSSNADSHWGISSAKKTRTFPKAQFGHDFPDKEGALFTVTNKNNKTESARQQTITINSKTSGASNGTTTVKQDAGVKTNRVWTDYDIKLTADPTTLLVIASNGNNNTSLITTSASRNMTYDWNNIKTDTGSDKQEGSPKLTISAAGGFASLSGSGTGSRVSVQKNYDASTLGQATPDRNAVVTATLANTENGHAASVKTVTITQKGGKVTETRDNWVGGSISTGGNISAYGGNTSITHSVPTRTVHVILDDKDKLSTYTESAVLASVTSSSGTFTVSGTTSVSAGSNLDGEANVYGNWSGGSVSVSTSSFGRDGGTSSISWTNPTRDYYKRYDTSARTATLTGNFTFGGSALGNNATATTTVRQSGCSDKINDTDRTETAGDPTLSENQSWSSISGTTLSVSSASSTSTEYWIGSGSLSISGSPIAAGGGTATANPSKPSCGWDEYYDAVNRSGNVTAKWTEGSISRSDSYSQSASRTKKDSGSGTADVGSVSWPSWCPNGSAGENTGSERSGTVSVTFTYNGERSTATATVRQNGAVITYGGYRITVSPTSMSWKGEDDDTKSKSYTVTGYRTKYINGTNAGEEKVSVSGIKVSCTGDFSGDSSSIWPDGTNETSSSKTGTATVTATPSGGTSCNATISLSQGVRDWDVTEGK